MTPRKSCHCDTAFLTAAQTERLQSRLAQVLNPIVALTRLAASLHHESGTIAVPGFYEDVVAVTPADEADMKAAANLDLSRPRWRRVGAKGPFGEAGYSTLARRHVT